MRVIYVPCPNSKCRRKLGPFKSVTPGMARCAHCGTVFRVR